MLSRRNTEYVKRLILNVAHKKFSNAKHIATTFENRWYTVVNTGTEIILLRVVDEVPGLYNSNVNFERMIPK